MKQDLDQIPALKQELLKLQQLLRDSKQWEQDYIKQQ